MHSSSTHSPSRSTEEEFDHLSYTQLDADNLADFKRLNQVIFPVRYSEKFYNDCRSAGKLTQLAFIKAELVGAIACRLEPQQNGHNKVYILTLGVYSAFRGQRIGTTLLQRMLQVAEEDPRVSEAYLHVQINNEDAIGFYLARGFQKGQVVQNYYRRIEPPHAVILHKSVRHCTSSRT